MSNLIDDDTNSILSVLYFYLTKSNEYYEKNWLEQKDWPLDESTSVRIKHSKQKVSEILDLKNWKLSEIFEKKYKRKISDKIISYPLMNMYDYIEKNIDDLKTWNDKQIEFAEKFKLSHMQEIKNIAEILGFNDVLNWSTINVSLSTFKKLKNELESIDYEWTIIWNQRLLSISLSLQEENYENMYLATVALWYKEKLWISNIKMPTRRILLILDYVKNNYWKPNNMDVPWDLLNFVIKEENINDIYSENLKYFVEDINTELNERQKTQIKSNIRSLLRGFWYKLEIDLKRSNKQK